MRVNIAYSVGLEEIPKEVANLLPKGLLQNDTMFQIIDNLENENVDSAITSIDNLRKDLFETDQRLADCMAILQGYLNTKYSQPPDPNSVQDELSNIQEQLESLGVELEMIQLVEVFNEVSSAMRGTSKYTLREVYINPKHVVAVRPDVRMKSVLQEGLLPEDLDERQSFTKVFLDRGQTGIDITVVGEAAIVSKKLGLHNRELLKG